MKDDVKEKEKEDDGADADADAERYYYALDCRAYASANITLAFNWYKIFSHIFF